VWFTFLPSFAFILIGGPLVEASRDNRRLSAPLTAITAAVSGVIASLAVFFVKPVLWPAQGGGALDGAALAILVASLVLLLHQKWGVIPLIGAAALVGLLRLFVLAWPFLSTLSPPFPLPLAPPEPHGS
ncbi:MAG: chromate transporter, partial [Cyanobacteriota bacterium]